MKNYKLHVELLIVLVGVVCTVYGLVQLDYNSFAVLSTKNLLQVPLPILAVLGCIELLSRALNIGRLVAGAVVIGLVSILTGALWALISCLLFFAASFVLGKLILSVLVKDHISNATTALLLGAAIYGTIIGLLAHYPFGYFSVYALLIMLPFFFGWRFFITGVSALYAYRNYRETSYLDLFIALMVVFYVFIALMPELGHDALAVHLFVPAYISHNQAWGFDVSRYVWAVMPMLADWIYTCVYMFAGESATRLVNVGFSLLLCWLIRDLVLWARGSLLGARWAVLLFLTTPLTLLENSTLYIEPVWSAFIVAGSLAIFRLLSSTHAKEHLLVAGVLLGAACASKSVTFTILPVLALLCLVFYKRWLNMPVVGGMIMAAIFFVVIGFVPYVTAWIIAGNPVFPFFNGYFQSPFYPAVNFEASLYGKGVAWDTIYQITFHSAKYLEAQSGAAGFQWLLLLLPAFVAFILALHKRALLLLIFSFLAVVLTFQQTAYLRYIFPSVVVMTAVIGVYLSRVFRERPNGLFKSFILVLVLGTIVLNLMFLKSGTYYGNIDIKSLLSEAGRTAFLQKRLPIRNAVTFINTINLQKSPVAIFSLSLTAGLSADPLYANWYNHRFQAAVKSAKDAKTMAEVLLDAGATYLILDKNWAQTPEKFHIVKDANEKYHMVKDATEEVAGFGPISVRRIKTEYLYTREQLKDTALVKAEPWQFSPSVRSMAAGVVVDVNSSAVQMVDILSSRKYLLTVTASCLTPSVQGRLQMSWLDSDLNTVETAVEIFECTVEPTAHSLNVVSPKHAAKAVVYATGHTAEPLIIHEVSLKK